MKPDISSIPLRDIHLPDSVSWWPLAPGWWITLGLLILAAATVYFLKWMKDRRQLGKQSMDEFASLVSRYQQDKDTHLLLTNLSQLLRRVCITQYDYQHIAGLTGDEWLKFLDEALVHHKNEQGLSFCGELGECLVTVQYQRAISVDEKKLDQLLILSKAWLQAVTNKPASMRYVDINFAEGGS